ncbi:hypothetical protein LOTGIDRAFT_125515 [Lottia gigantea]|uniref:Fanconi anemia group D2 protein n=1 Tax=Lottia gigantea TaxID=225164 RepID=V3ZCS3_LOTGI|nr:hypothetical protein LOTGIDRAFT_125515 [Lottia gigantea]ESO88868.1 hypothetical protein LOTGIDRAFT_125515 [Lottia gigantea]
MLLTKANLFWIGILILKTHVQQIHSILQISINLRHFNSVLFNLVSSTKKRKVRDNNYNEKSVFTELVSTCGIILKDGSANNEISIDQAMFQKNLVVAMKAHETYPETVNELLEGLQNYMSEDKRFHKVLMPTITSTDCDNARASIQDSVVRILMGVDMLQNDVMNMLLEKLPEFIGDAEYNGEKLFVPHLLLSQFRWLDRIIDCKKLSKKLIEMISITSLDIQREIITCLPEIIEDSEHATVANTLRDVLLEGNQLTVAVLDALSNLNLTSELLLEVRGSVIQTLKSVELEDLPVVIKFLLQTVTNQDSLEVRQFIGNISDLNIDILYISFYLFQASLQYMSRTSEKDCETLTLDAIKSGIHFQRTVAEAFIKAIDNVKAAGEQKVLDLFVLLILYNTSRKKTVESLFRNKIRSGCFSENFLQSSFSSYSQILRDYFTSILSLCEVLLRSPEPVVSYFACSLYKHCFLYFDSFCKQEIVSSLVTHIGSGLDSEMDSSLHILVDLVENNLKAMVPFAIFVKGVLDYLDNLSVCQIRQLYSMLSRLAFYDTDEGGMIQDDLHIIIRKQLSSSNPKYKRMGVIGAIMIVKSMAVSKNDTEELEDDIFRQVISLLQLVRNSCSNNPQSSALFMDELSSVINKGRLATNIENWISENVTSDFQDDFVVDIEEGKDWLVPLELSFGLNDEEESAIAIDLLPLIIHTSDRKKSTLPKQPRSPQPLCLSPHFRLVQICEYKQQDGNLEGIDALIGCPIYTVKRDVIDKISSLSQKEKEIICTTLFYEINWFIEMVNGFATQTDAEMKGKVICRLINITDSQRLLEKCLAETTNYIPPLANFDLEDKPQNTSTASTFKESKKSTKKQGKKLKGDKVNLDDSDETSRGSTQSEKSQVKDNKENKNKAVVSLSSYTKYFRELDIHVFTMLTTSLITKSALDSQQNTKLTEELKLQPAQLNFLLEDLVQKLSHSLLSTTNKRRTFLKTKVDKNIGYSHLDQLSSNEIIANIISLLPSLCDHLEKISSYFQKEVEDNDGVIDSINMSTDESKYMMCIFKHLLQCFLSVFSWNGFLMHCNNDILKQSLQVLISRIKTGDSTRTQSTFQELIRGSFKYLQNFSNTILNLESGVLLIKVLIVIAKKYENTELQQKIATLACDLLKREWRTVDGEREKGQKHNELLQIVIRTYIVHSEEQLSAIETLTTKGIPELIDADKNGSSNTFPSLTRNSFAVYFRVIFNQLIDSIKSISPYKQTDTKQSKMDKLIQWNMAVRIHHVLVNLLKVFDGRAILGTVLKYGRQFVEVFYRQAMPLLDSMFRFHREDVQSILKTFQLSTRTLHHLCGHTKIIKDISLTNQVPLLKKALEAFVYRVMLMLTVNKCPEAFWMGNLKNRDLQGCEILSQVSEHSSASDGGGQGKGSDEEADDVPDEDDDESEVVSIPF